MATSVAAIDTDKQVISTHYAEVLCIQIREVSGLALCTNEEAGTRILLHMEDVVTHGYSKVSMAQLTMDVIVLTVTSTQRLNITELWVSFGTGSSFGLLTRDGQSTGP